MKLTRPGEFINIIISEPHHVHEHWPSHVTSLEHFRTVAFDRSMMHQTITIGWFEVNDPKRPWVGSEHGLMLGTWLCIVPECYRENVTKLATETFDRTLKNQLQKRHSLDLYIDELRNCIWSQLEPIYP